MTMIRDCSPPITRRGFVGAAGALGAGVLCGAGFFGMPASAAGARDPRLVVIILRGAVDGLSAVPPVGDPDYADLQGDLAFTASGDRAALPLDGFFSAHPSLAVFKRLYERKQAMVVHAVATGYRDRSHFDGQDVLESGYPGPGRTESGWLNRALGALPASGASRAQGLGVGAIAPLVIRGPAPALGWAPPGGIAPAGSDLAERVLDLYAHGDPALGNELAEALTAEKIANDTPSQGAGKPRAGGPGEAMRIAAAGAARLLAAPDGPRIAALAYDGFDTHQNEGAARGCSPSVCKGSMQPSKRSRPTSASPGKTPSSSRSPSSAARCASTAPTAPITARERSRSSPAGRSRGAG
jgi:uncharacterized protein (DUF1501 family)